jgi:hypothetical protein
MDSHIHLHGMHRDERARSNTSFVVQNNFAIVTNDFYPIMDLSSLSSGIIQKKIMTEFV